jgi:hypothetical protein
LDDVDDSGVRNRIAQGVAIIDLLAINEKRHMLAEPAGIVKNVAAGALVGGKICVEHFTQRGTGHLKCRTVDVPLDVAGKPDGRHLEMISEPAAFFCEPQLPEP